MPAPLDLQKLAKVLGRLGSDHAGERDAAARTASKMIRVVGMVWDDFIEAAVRREEAERRASNLYDAARRLVAERDHARAELNRLREVNGHTSGLTAALWVDTRTPQTVENKHATWVLSLGIYLSGRERSFVERCTRWRGPLTPGMRPWLQDIVRRAVERTGEAPPS